MGLVSRRLQFVPASVERKTWFLHWHQSAHTFWLHGSLTELSTPWSGRVVREDVTADLNRCSKLNPSGCIYSAAHNLLTISFRFFATFPILNFLNWNFCFLCCEAPCEPLGSEARETGRRSVFINKNLASCTGSPSSIHLIQYCSYNNACRHLGKREKNCIWKYQEGRYFVEQRRK